MTGKKERTETAPIPAGTGERPAWVAGLGLYGRAAYEWRRALDPAGLRLMEDPATVLQEIDETVSDLVRHTVQAWLRARPDPSSTEVAGLPPTLAVDDRDQVLTATQAAEIRPCLELVYRPAPEAPGGPASEASQVSASRGQAELLATKTWETRPTMTDLRQAATDLAETIAEEEKQGQAIPSAEVLIAASPHCWLTEPTALLPTEVRVGTRALTERLGRPVDLYLLFE
jgi:hypothetical protein